MHNPALLLDWHRFSSDTMVAIRPDAGGDVARTLPRPSRDRQLCARSSRKFDHFDMAEAVDFVSIESNVADQDQVRRTGVRHRHAALAQKNRHQNARRRCAVFGSMEQKAGQVNWQEVNSLVRPGLSGCSPTNCISRGASGVLYFRWRQPRIGSEKFYGAILPHHLEGNDRIFKEISQIGEEIKMLAPALKDTKVVAEVCILYSHENEWALQQPMPAEQIFQPARTHPAHLQRAARPQYSGGFRAAHRGFVPIQNRLRAVAAFAGRRRSRQSEALRPKRRHAGRHVQHRPGGRASHRARHRLSRTT